MNREATLSPEEQVMNMLFGGLVMHMISCATQLGVFDTLAKSATSAAQIAERAGTMPDTTYRLLRALSVLGFTREENDQTFSLGPLGSPLRSDVPGSFAPLATLVGREWYCTHLTKLMYSLRTGHSAFRAQHGTPLFDWLSEHPSEERLFSQAMSTLSGMEVHAMLDAYDFSGYRHVVDIAGAHGQLLEAILSAAPESQATLFDVPGVIGEAQRVLAAKRELSARVSLVSGDFFREVPSGGDLYTLKHILHDWDDERALKILRNVARAMPAGARVLVAEQGIAPPGVAHPGKILDVAVLTMLEGARERTAEQHAVLMQQAGLRFEREIPTAGPITMFIGAK
jgi:O-methyltransferase domain/Dimerisation domain